MGGGISENHTSPCVFKKNKIRIYKKVMNSRLIQLMCEKELGIVYFKCSSTFSYYAFVVFHPYPESFMFSGMCLHWKDQVCVYRSSSVPIKKLSGQDPYLSRVDSIDICLILGVLFMYWKSNSIPLHIEKSTVF